MNQQVTYRLRHTIGEVVQWESPLAEGVYVLGRAYECQFVLEDTRVSRRHAQLEITATGCWLMDLGSANGTSLQGQPLQPRRKVAIAPGQSFGIQEHTFTLISAAGAPPRPAEGALPQMPAAAWVPSSPPPRRMALRFRRKDGPWQEFLLNEGEQTIGRLKTNEIVLDSPAVSRQHARLILQGEHLTLVDLGSSNGVFRQGTRLPANQPVPLAAGESFQIDVFDLEVFWKESPAALAATPGAKVEGTMMVSEADLAGLQPAFEHTLNLRGSERTTIGRARDNTVVLDHPMISRYHAVIERMGTRSRLTNLHSANGVFVNGQLVEHSIWLKPGDAIKLGPYQFHFSGNELAQARADSYNIDVIGLNKWVSKTLNLLKNISLSIGQNEFVALVGMSGAGKSTLMDAINGFRPATQGLVLVNGINLYDNYNMFRDDIGNVPQRDIVHMELTPEQALSYASRLRMPRDTSPKERQMAVQETLANLGLSARKDIPIARLSGGQLKRVSIGVELLTKPRLFFLDEPTSGLDPGTEYEMMKLLRRLADQGRTIMIITHATKNVMFCDKAIILARGGNLAFYGPPEEALQYFDQFRTNREKLEKDMEFDDIYHILNDEARGTPEEWRERYLRSPYARYIQPRHQPAAAPKLAAGRARWQRRRISSLSQFFILSARNLKCMFQDKATLGLTIALAPVLGLMNFIWGNRLFDPVHGDAIKVMMMWFVTTFIAILVGAMGSVREIIKEADIYKRERAVGLKILPYVLAKAWIGFALAVYQGGVLLLFVILLTNPQISAPAGYLALLVTIILAVISGYMLGLLVSAVVPNQNSAMIVLIAFLVPQLLFTGVLMPLDKIPLGNVISPAISARWAYESFVNATGMGDPLVADPCWQLPPEERAKLTSTQKESCNCLGPKLFIHCGQFPGIKSPDYYDEAARQALAQGEPLKPLQPTRLPSPTPLPSPSQLPTPTLLATPTLLPTPTAPPTPTRLPLYIPPAEQQATQNAGISPEEAATRAVANAYYRVNKYQNDTNAQFEEYRQTREAQFSEYQDQTMRQMEEYKSGVKDQLSAYQEQVKAQINQHIEAQTGVMTEYGNQVQKQFEDYASAMQAYGNTLSDWEKHRQEAIGAAETILAMVYDDFGHAFHGSVTRRWYYMGLIIVAEFVLILILQKRKDVI